MLSVCSRSNHTHEIASSSMNLKSFVIYICLLWLIFSVIWVSVTIAFMIFRSTLKTKLLLEKLSLTAVLTSTISYASTTVWLFFAIMSVCSLTSICRVKVNSFIVLHYTGLSGIGQSLLSLEFFWFLICFIIVIYNYIQLHALHISPVI